MITLSSERATLTVDPSDGGRMISLLVDGREILGRSEPVPGMPVGIFSGSFVLAPFIGRLRHGSFSFEGREYRVPLNAGEHAIHGLAFDVPWDRDGDDLVLAFDDRWPFGGEVRQSFDLRDDGLTVTATVSNEERRMPACVGFHPWFARAAGHDELTYDVQPGPRYETDADGIPDGSFDTTQDARPWDDSFLGMTQPPVLQWGDLRVSLDPTAPNWIVCETMPDGICVEPLSAGVGALHSDEPPVVEPGRPLSLRLELTWR